MKQCYQLLVIRVIVKQCYQLLVINHSETVYQLLVIGYSETVLSAVSYKSHSETVLSAVSLGSSEQCFCCIYEENKFIHGTMYTFVPVPRQNHDSHMSWSVLLIWLDFLNYHLNFLFIMLVIAIDIENKFNSDVKSDYQISTIT